MGEARDGKCLVPAEDRGNRGGRHCLTFQPPRGLDGFGQPRVKEKSVMSHFVILSHFVIHFVILKERECTSEAQHRA
jgi:hypothetical protein